MAKITVLGWYGTETIGDRAIFSGIVKLLNASVGETEIRLGSLFIPLTERTIIEDYSFICKCANDEKLRISIFNSFSTRELRENIVSSDLIIVGGGPLMDMSVMYMLEYAFIFAKKHNKKTALIGCGWGPLNLGEYRKCAISIIQKSDLVIFRDKRSYKQYSSYCTDIANVSYSIDPAFFAAYFYKSQRVESPKHNFICANFRDISLDKYKGNAVQVERICCQIISDILQAVPYEILLIPMHTFYIGGDDRDFLLKIWEKVNAGKRVSVQQNPLSLEKTMEIYYDSFFCVGMRYHSIVLQTALNGNNYIIDYTDPNNGKIKGMLNTLNLYNRYKSRYISIFNNDKFQLDFIETTTEINPVQIKHYENAYVKNIKNMRI